MCRPRGQPASSVVAVSDLRGGSGSVTEPPSLRPAKRKTHIENPRPSFPLLRKRIPRDLMGSRGKRALPDYPLSCVVWKLKLDAGADHGGGGGFGGW